MKRFILAIICAGVAAGAFSAWPFLAQEQPGKLARLIQDGKRAAAFEAIRAGADVNEAQLDGTRPVHWAVYRVDYDLLAELIAKKAKVDVANEFGYTPLSEAAKQGDARMVKMLMDAGSGTEGANDECLAGRACTCATNRAAVRSEEVTVRSVPFLRGVR